MHRTARSTAASLGHHSVRLEFYRSRSAVWDGRGDDGLRVASGVYLYRITGRDGSSGGRLLFVK